MRAAALLLIVIVPGLSGCAVEVALEGKACDVERECVAGFVCLDESCVAEESLARCVRDADCASDEECAPIGRCLPRPATDAGTLVDAGGSDAGPAADSGILEDSGPEGDAGDDDGGPLLDAGPVDAGSFIDAGPSDAGPACESQSVLGSWPLEAPSGRGLPLTSLGLIAGWELEGDLSSVTGSHAATGAVASFEPGVVGNAVQGPITVASAPALLFEDGLTFAAWVRLDVPGAYGVVSVGSSTPGDGWRITTSAASDLQVHVDGTSDAELNGAPLVLGEWQHVALTWDRVDVRLWQNGVVTSSAPFTSAIDYDDADMILGGAVEAPDLAGALDQAALWDRPLSEAELANLIARGFVVETVSGARAPLRGGRAVSGAQGSALRFLGDGGHARLSEGAFASSGAFTLSFFFAPAALRDATSPTSAAFASAYLDDESHFWLGLAGTDFPRPEVPAGAVVVKTKAGSSGVSYYTSERTFAADEWHHVAVVWGGPSTPAAVLYLDGVETGFAGTAGAGDDTFSLAALNAPMLIGSGAVSANTAPQDTAFDGRLDEVHLIAEALSPQEIADLAAGASPCAP